VTAPADLPFWSVVDERASGEISDALIGSYHGGISNREMSHLLEHVWLSPTCSCTLQAPALAGPLLLQSTLPPPSAVHSHR
jgi:hypothetical protein